MNSTVISRVLLAAAVMTSGCAGRNIQAGSASVELADQGLVSRVTLGEQVVINASGHEGFCPVVLETIEPEDGNDGAFPPVLGKVVPASTPVVRLQDLGSSKQQAISVVSGDVSGDLVISLAPSDKYENAVNIKCRAMLSGDGLVTAVGISIPMAIGSNEYWRRTTVGGGNPQHTTEAWRYDENHARRGWPRWRIGGLLADSEHHYLTWKACHTEAPILPMDEGAKCPGWLDYSEQDWGLTVFWSDIHEHAPAGIWMDGEDGVMTIYLHPPTALPIQLADGKASRNSLEAELELVFHKGPLPVTFVPELPREKYLELLKAMHGRSRNSYLDMALREYDVRTPEELVDSGIQPSLALAVAGGANYRMRALCETLEIPYDEQRANAQPRKYGEELIQAIVRQMGGKTDFRF